MVRSASSSSSATCWPPGDPRPRAVVPAGPAADRRAGSASTPWPTSVRALIDDVLMLDVEDASEESLALAEEQLAAARKALAALPDVRGIGLYDSADDASLFERSPVVRAVERPRRTAGPGVRRRHDARPRDLRRDLPGTARAGARRLRHLRVRRPARSGAGRLRHRRLHRNAVGAAGGGHTAQPPGRLRGRGLRGEGPQDHGLGQELGRRSAVRRGDRHLRRARRRPPRPGRAPVPLDLRDRIAICAAKHRSPDQEPVWT